MRTSRKPFRFLLCGDPALIAELRALLLSGHDDGATPLDAAACLETVATHGHSAHRSDAKFASCSFSAAAAISPAPTSARSQPSKFRFWPSPSTRKRSLPDRLHCLRPARMPNTSCRRSREKRCAAACSRTSSKRPKASKSPSAAACRRLRETVAAKLTRDAANNALKVALASAVVDHIPVVGIVLGAFASAGDMVAITGIQMMLLLHIQAAYGKDPDVQRMWQLLPVIGGGFGWRTLARELVGFVPVAGIAIKGAIAYAGTIVVGEGVTFFLEHGRHMSKGQASQIYERTKEDAMRFARDFATKFKNN